MKRLNEFNALEALVDISQVLLGCAYRPAGSPDDLDSSHKEVDFLLMPETTGYPTLAVEHTVVEAFGGQRTYLLRSHEIVQLVDNKCSGLLPSDKAYALVLPPELVVQLGRKNVDSFVEAIAPWVVRSAPPLDVEGYMSTHYADEEIYLLCNGSIPDWNGKVGRMPGSPKKPKELVSESLARAIDHGIGKFAKYRNLGYSSVLSLENVSGIAHPSTLARLASDPLHKSLVGLIDYVIVFASNEDRMIVGTVWKEKRVLHDPIPYSRRFRKIEGKWRSFDWTPQSLNRSRT